MLSVILRIVMYVVIVNLMRIKNIPERAVAAILNEAYLRIGLLRSHCRRQWQPS